jgi:Domain of unknown function (DUF5655)
MVRKAPAKARGPKVPSAGGGSRGASWQCSVCARSFTRINQRHACGTGDRREVLRNRPDFVVRLYASVEAFARALGPIEVVARERYVLLRSVRIFADLVIMTDAVRIAVHLKRKLADPIFFKVASSDRAVTHVAKLRTERDFSAVKPYLKEAYELSLEPAKKPSRPRPSRRISSGRWRSCRLAVS